MMYSFGGQLTCITGVVGEGDEASPAGSDNGPGRGEPWAATSSSLSCHRGAGGLVKLRVSRPADWLTLHVLPTHTFRVLGERLCPSLFFFLGI